MTWRAASWTLLLALLSGSGALAGERSINPRTMAAIATVDERFQSYNVEMVEVTGGRFWKPFAEASTPERTEKAAAAQTEREMYASRPPIDLANARLRKLAAALAPAYMRVSGTWANATYFADSDPPPRVAPPGFESVLTRGQWRGVLEFAKAVNARIATSFAVSPGTRDAAGVWQTEQARRVFAYTNLLGGEIAAVEYMNEPSLAAQNGAPAGYDAAAYGRDFRIFRRLLKAASPKTLLVGPGSVGESTDSAASGLISADLLAASGRGIHRFSYHHYNTVSPRCGGKDRPEDALSEDWLSRTDKSLAFYRALRDRFEPGKALWLTETADAACGGNRWDSTFVDTFRYLDQLGRLARAGVQVVMHNTLAASDYGLLDESSFEPRPNYWGALLWHRLMGRTVLDAGVPPEPGLHVYAHCLRDRRGGVTVLALNTSPDTPRSLSLPTASERYTLRAARLEEKSVELNGQALRLGASDEWPAFVAVAASAGAVTLPPASITFLTVPTAGNRACR